jgi:hypothetical protein
MNQAILIHEGRPNRDDRGVQDGGGEMNERKQANDDGQETKPD